VRSPYLLEMAQLIYFENRGLAEISRMLMTLTDIEVSCMFAYRACFHGRPIGLYRPASVNTAVGLRVYCVGLVPM